MMDKLQFLRNEFVEVLKTISSSTEPLFAKMNFHIINSTANYGKDKWITKNISELLDFIYEIICFHF